MCIYMSYPGKGCFNLSETPQVREVALNLKELGPTCGGRSSGSRRFPQAWRRSSRGSGLP